VGLLVMDVGVFQDPVHDRAVTAADIAGIGADADNLSSTQQGRTIEFAGRQWFVKSGYGGPGPNYWSDSEQSVWVDGNGRLHLKLRNLGGTWYAAEVYSVERTRYGLHRFYVDAPLDSPDENVVFAPFLYQDDEHEIDIEFTKWGNPSNPNNAQYVVQPWYHTGNLERFSLALNGTFSTHYMDWRSSYIQFKSIHGHYQEPPDPGFLINDWLYVGDDIPPEEGNLRIHMNLWLVGGNPPSDGQEVEVIIADADFPPLPSVGGRNGDPTAAQWLVLSGRRWRLFHLQCRGRHVHAGPIERHRRDRDGPADGSGER